MYIEERVKEIIAEKLGIKIESLTNKNLMERHNADELDILEIIYNLEYEFDIDLDYCSLDLYSTDTLVEAIQEAIDGNN